MLSGLLNLYIYSFIYVYMCVYIYIYIYIYIYGYDVIFSCSPYPHCCWHGRTIACLYLSWSCNKIESLFSTLIFFSQQLDYCNSLLAGCFSTTISNCNMYKAELLDWQSETPHWRRAEAAYVSPFLQSLVERV